MIFRTCLSDYTTSGKVQIPKLCVLKVLYPWEIVRVFRGFRVLGFKVQGGEFISIQMHF